MLAKMPYGPVEITNKKDAQSFVIHMCDNCERNNEPLFRGNGTAMSKGKRKGCPENFF